MNNRLHRRAGQKGSQFRKKREHIPEEFPILPFNAIGLNFTAG